MAKFHVLCMTFLFAILSIQQCICSHTPENSPSPAPAPVPESGGDLSSPSPLSSPPAPPPEDRSPYSSPAPSPVDGEFLPTFTPSPAPAPSDSFASDISHETTVDVNESSSGDGMNGGKKAGVAFGVIAAACVVGLGALVYKKRRQNMRRAQFGYAARRDFL